MSQTKATHPLSALHIIGILALLGWWMAWAWTHHPVREAMRAQTAAAARRAAREAPKKTGAATPSFSGVGNGMEEKAKLLKAAAPDFVAGFGIILLFAIGSGVYVTRIEVWLQARSAGEAVALRGIGLEESALGANADRKKGAAL